MCATCKKDNDSGSLVGKTFYPNARNNGCASGGVVLQIRSAGPPGRTKGALPEPREAARQDDGCASNDNHASGSDKRQGEVMQWWRKPEICAATKQQHQKSLDDSKETLEKFQKIAKELTDMLKAPKPEPTD